MSTLTALYAARDNVILVLFAVATAAAFNWHVWLREVIHWPTLSAWPWTRRIEIGPILYLAGFLRIVGIAHDALWYDEAFSVTVAQLPLAQLIAATAGDVHPPTWYFVTKLFLPLGTPIELVARLPAAICGGLAVWLAYRVLRDMGGENHALGAAALLAISPVAIYYSNEARMYALLLVLVLAAVWAAWHANSVGAGLAMGAAMLTHNLGGLYVPVVCALLWRRGGLRRALYAGALAGALWGVLWGPVVWAQLGALSAQGYWIEKSQGITIARWLHEVKLLLFGPAVPLWIIPLDSLAGFALLLLPTIEAVRRKSELALVLVWLALAPALEMLAISLAWKPMTLSRPLIGSLPFWLALIVWWIRLPRRWDGFRQAALGLAAALFALTAGYYYFADRNPHTRELAAWLRENAQGEMIVHINPSDYIALHPYLAGLRTCRYSSTAYPFDLISPQCGADLAGGWLLQFNSPFNSPWAAQRAAALIAQYHAQPAQTFNAESEHNVVVWRLYEKNTLDPFGALDAGAAGGGANAGYSPRH